MRTFATIFTIVNMNRKTIITILLALVAMLGQAQTKVWNKIVTGYANVPVMSITKVSIYDDRTEVFFRLEVPEQAAGDSLPIAAKPTLRVGGKEYAVKGATVISLSEPYKIPADGKVDFSLIFEPIPASTWMIDVAEPDTWFFANVHDAENLPNGIADTYWRNEAMGDWQKAIKPYTLYLDFTSFMRDYLREVIFSHLFYPSGLYFSLFIRYINKAFSAHKQKREENSC